MNTIHCTLKEFKSIKIIHYRQISSLNLEEKQFSCEICGKSFNHSHNRNRHRKTHRDKNIPINSEQMADFVVCGEDITEEINGEETLNYDPLAIKEEAEYDDVDPIMNVTVEMKEEEPDYDDEAPDFRNVKVEIIEEEPDVNDSFSIKEEPVHNDDAYEAVNIKEKIAGDCLSEKNINLIDNEEYKIEKSVV